MRFGVRELLFFFVLLAVPIASFVYVFKPRNDEIRQAKDEIEIKQAKLDKLAAIQQQLKDVGLAIERGRESIELIEAKLPSQRDVEGILEQVWQLASRNGLVQKSVKSERPVSAAGYMELPLKVVMEGEFGGFYSFLLELENLQRITRLHKMKLQTIGDSGKGGGSLRGGTPAGWMKIEFTLSIYFQP